jgi:hypothetical protein
MIQAHEPRRARKDRSRIDGNCEDDKTTETGEWRGGGGLTNSAILLEVEGRRRPSRRLVLVLGRGTVII